MKKLLSLITLLTVGITLSACQKPPEGDPQTVINNAWEKLAEKNASYETGEMKFSGNGNLEVDSNKAAISGSGTILFDSSDEKNMKSSIALDLDGSGEFQGQKGSVALTAEIRVLEKTLYLMLNKVNVDTGNPQTNLIVNMAGNLYKSQWLSLPSDTVNALETATLENFKGKEMGEIAKKHHFFEVKTDLGSGKYDLTVNAEKLKNYFTEIGEASGTPVKEEDLAAIDNLFKTLDYTLQVEVDSDFDLTWIKGNLKAKDTPNQQEMVVDFEADVDENESEGYIDLVLNGEAPGKARVEFDIEHQAKPVTIEKPENAQEFDLGALLGGLGPVTE